MTIFTIFIQKNMSKVSITIFLIKCNITYTVWSLEIKASFFFKFNFNWKNIFYTCHKIYFLYHGAQVLYIFLFKNRNLWFGLFLWNSVIEFYILLNSFMGNFTKKYINKFVAELNITLCLSNIELNWQRK